MSITVKERLSRGGRQLHVLRLIRSSVYLSLLALSSTLDSISAFDNIGLEAYWPRPAVELEEEAAGIAEHRSDLVSSP